MAISQTNGNATYYRITSKADSAEIFLYEPIGEDIFGDGIGAKNFAQDLKNLGNVNNIILHINSPGGSVFEGLAIYNQLKAHKASITVLIDGLAASIASVIAMAGDRILMPENAMLMVHDPLALILGNAQDLMKMVETLGVLKQSIISAYRDKTGLSDVQISDLMTAETWMNGKDAVELGFADLLVNPIKIAAHFDLSKFKNAPISLNNIKSKGLRTMEDQIIDDSWKKDKHEERSRVRELLAIGKQHNCLDLAMQFVDEGRTVDELKGSVLDEIRKGVKPINVTGRASSPKGPFASFGEQLIAVKNAGTPGQQTDPRLFRAAASGMNESAPSEGGFLVQPEFITDLLRRAYDTGVLPSRCMRIPIGPNANGMKINALDESSRVTGSRLGGVQTRWANEADTVTAAKPKFRSMSLYLNKLMGLSYATDELLQDSPALEAVITESFAQEIGFVLDDVILNGSGSGQPLGILNSGALVTVSKEPSQLSKTIETENILKMWSRLWSRGESNAIWVINRDVLPQLYTLMLGSVPMFMPPGGLNAQPFSTLLGRPVISLEQCPSLGTVGDIMLLDLSQYLIVDKGGVDAQQSIHVRFIYDETCFRFTYRVDGQPIWNKPLDPFQGSNSVSPFVALETRA